MAYLLAGTTLVGILIFNGRTRWLVGLTLVTLVWGTSILPLVSVAFTAKFAMLTGLALAAVLPVFRPRWDRTVHLPVAIGAAVAAFSLVGFALLSSAWSLDPAGSTEKALSMLV